MTEEKRALAETLFRQHGPILKAGFLREHGIYNRVLAELARDGYVQKLKTGYYIWNTAAPDVSDVETAAALVPFGIVCLQSAAVLHEMTTLNPLAVTIAIPSNRTRITLPEYPPVELVSSAMPTFEMGATKTDGIRVYNRERTVCDFFRKRNQLGDDLALEVLQSYMRGTRDLQTLFDYAGALRVKGVIKPYVEALI
ncbi:MAG: type IV toxin-antitoxin system AbiEi family antitoxin domain-containing protein [Defluviitaleaceae bacterium]|nr:type IV toxin-antitoxin system AbiEi family antitoxin domain-containing protein [Defluviitaleaceae bacterium]